MQTRLNSLPENLRKTATDCLERYGDKVSLLETFNADNQHTYTQDLTRVFTGKAPTLVDVRNAHGDGTAQAWAMGQLVNLSEYCGVKDKLDNWQLEQLAKVIVSDFGWLKLTELMYFFRLFKAGRFGRFYGSIDPMLITEALQQFLRIRADELTRIEQQRKAQERRQTDEAHDRNILTYAEAKEKLKLKNL